jgi:glucose-6-phosphate-specific signal transduction histidine kinase
MPVLPIIDLLIFLGWTTLAAGGLLKAIHIATSYRPTLFSLAPTDLLLVAFAFLGLALTLAARTWVRLNEPHLIANRRAAASRDAVSRAVSQDQVAAAQPVTSAAGAPGRPPGAADPVYGWQRVR